MSLLTGARISFLGNSFWIIKLNSVWTVLLLPLCDQALKTMFSFLHANLISGRVGFVLSCFYNTNFSCSGFIVARTVQSWNSIDLPDPVGKTPTTSWPFRIDSKHFTCRVLKLSDGKLPLLRENPTRRSNDKHSGLPAILDILFIVCDRMLI